MPIDRAKRRADRDKARRVTRAERFGGDDPRKIRRYKAREAKWDAKAARADRLVNSSGKPGKTAGGCAVTAVAVGLTLAGAVARLRGLA